MAIGRAYSVIFNLVTVSAQQDFFEVAPGTNKPIEILGLQLSQTSEVGDAMEEALNVCIKSGATSTGSGGTTPTAIPRVTGDTAFGGTCKVNNTAKASGGTIVAHEVWNWNVRVPFQMIWIPEMTIMIAGAGRVTVELGTTPADAITMSGCLWIREYS